MPSHDNLRKIALPTVVALTLYVSVGLAAAQPPALAGIDPPSGPVGTALTLRGSGFTATDNTVMFGEGSAAYADGSMNAGLSSRDGDTISFTVPRAYTPACAYTVHCRFAQRLTTPGVYAVRIININGRSNERKFSVSRQ